MKKIGGIAMALMAFGILAASTPAYIPERDEKRKRLEPKFDPSAWREAPKKPTKRQARRAKGQNRRIID